MLRLWKRRKQILFISRGKGRGHAIPDAAIANELVMLEPTLDPLGEGPNVARSI